MLAAMANTEPQKWHCSLRASIRHLLQIEYFRLLSASKDQQFVITRIDTSFVYGFVFPTYTVSDAITIWKLMENLTHRHKIPYNIAFDKESIVKEVRMDSW